MTYIRRSSTPIGFYAGSSAGNYTIGDNVDVPFDTAVYNIGGAFNTSNYRFTAPVAGRYLFCANIFVVTAYGRISLKVNGASYSNMQTNSGVGQIVQTGILYLNKGDYVTVGNWQSGLSGSVIFGGHSSFSGMLLG